jgi:HPt (histidine-containing phosphotransfer) domain-containing protein
MAMGMDAFLGKPLRITQLSAQLRRWLPHVEFPAGSDASTSESPMETPAMSDDEVLSAPSAPVDRAVLNEIAGHDATLARNLLHDFLAAVRTDLTGLRAAHAAADLAEATRQAHRIKGAAALVGARDVQRAAADAEAAGRANDADSLESAARALGGAVDVLAVWVER